MNIAELFIRDTTPPEFRELAEKAERQIISEDVRLSERAIKIPSHLSNTLISHSDNSIALVKEMVDVGPVTHGVRVVAVGCACCENPDMRCLVMTYAQRIGGERGKVIYREAWVSGEPFALMRKAENILKKAKKDAARLAGSTDPE